VGLVRAEVAEERVAYIFRVERIGELGARLKNAIFWDVTPCGSCHPDNEGDTFLAKVDSYKIHTAQHRRTRHSS
jgi:hypothetical protein